MPRNISHYYFSKMSKNITHYFLAKCLKISPITFVQNLGKTVCYSIKYFVLKLYLTKNVCPYPI